MLSSKVVWVALVCAVVVCGYPISEPRDALDQDVNYGQYIRNLEKKHRFSYNEIDEPLQPVSDDDEIELSLLAQPVSQPPSEDGIAGSTSRPIAFSKDSVEEDDKSSESPVEQEDKSSESPIEQDDKSNESPAQDDADSSESMKVDKDSSDEAQAMDETNVKVALESETEKQVESSQDSERAQEEEPLPVAEEVAPVADPVEEVVPSEIAPFELAAESPTVQDESLDVASPVGQSEQEPVEGLSASDVTEGSLSPVTDAPVASDANEEPKEELQAVESIQAEDSPSTDLPVQFGQNAEVAQDETVTPASVSENDEGSGFLAADPGQAVEAEKDSSADELEGSGFLVADPQPEKEAIIRDELVEDESGFFTGKTEVSNDEGSGFLADPLSAEATHDGSGESDPEEGSGLFDEIKIETTEELKVSETTLAEADGSGDAEKLADEESTASPVAENDEASLSVLEAHSSDALSDDHIEQSDNSPVKEEPKMEEPAAEDSVKYIPVEVIVDTEGQSNTEEKVNEPETTESSSVVETGTHQSSDVAALPEADNTETVQPDQPSLTELVPDTGLLADNAESASEQPQKILQSDELIPATEEPQQSSTLI